MRQAQGQAPRPFWQALLARLCDTLANTAADTPLYDPIQAAQEDAGVLLEGRVQHRRRLREAAARLVALGIIQPCSLQARNPKL